MSPKGAKMSGSKNVRVRTVKRKVVQGADGYKWPYYDSYVPGIGMD